MPRCPPTCCRKIEPRAVPKAMVEALKAQFGERCSTAAGGARAARPGRVADRRAAARGGGLLRKHRGGRLRRQAGRPARGPGDSIRRRLVARGPPAGGAGRREHRPVADEQDARGQRRGPDGDRPGRRDPDPGQRRDPSHGPVLPDRPGCRRLDRRHVRHPGQRHQRGPLRHDARERARPHRRHGERRGHPHRHAGTQVVGRLRPDPTDGRQRRHARRHDRDHAARLSAARGDVGRHLHLPLDRRGGADDDPDHPDGHPDRPLRAARPVCGAGGEPPRRSCLCPKRRCS